MGISDFIQCILDNALTWIILSSTILDQSHIGQIAPGVHFLSANILNINGLYKWDSGLFILILRYHIALGHFWS